MKRQMIQVDEALCDGCGQCMPACPEGALALVDGKARLVRQSYCDGLGACLGECPQGALRVLELDADAYDEAGVIAHLQQASPALVEKHVAHLSAHAPGLSSPSTQPPPAPSGASRPVAKRSAASPAGCPSITLREWEPEAEPATAASVARLRSELRQWPVQLHLLPPRAPYFQDADLLLVADCVPFASPNFHADFLRGNAVAMGCPKLDDADAYLDKVTQILKMNDIRSLKVAYMEVPCCRGLVFLAKAALEQSGKDIPFETVMVSIES